LRILYPHTVDRLLRTYVWDSMAEPWVTQANDVQITDGRNSDAVMLENSDGAVVRGISAWILELLPPVHRNGARRFSL
jgi:hypothetical protein